LAASNQERRAALLISSQAVPIGDVLMAV